MEREEHKSHNIGWAGCIYIHPGTQTVLAVQSLQRRRAVEKIMEETGLQYRDAIQRLEKEGINCKHDAWGPPGGRIEWWKIGRLGKEYECLTSEEKRQFEETVRERVLSDDALLEEAADATAHYEIVEESGLLIRRYRFLRRIDDRDRSGVAPFYPRFWYLVEEAEGSLLTGFGEEGLSPPMWIPLQKMHPLRDHGSRFPFFPVHAEAVKAALEALIAGGEKSLKPALEYLERTFRKWEPRASQTDEESWDVFSRSVTPL